MDFPIPNNLRALRQAAGYSQEEVADAAGVAIKAYNRYEYGIREPKVRIANRIARFLNTTTDQIWSSY